MSTDIFALNDEDRSWFVRLVGWFKSQRPERGPPTHRPPPGESEWATVVLTPIGGIPAMWEEVSGTGTGTRGNSAAGTGTGTSIGDAGDRPGFAECDEYLLDHATPHGYYLSHPRLVKTGRAITVYNPSFTAVSGNQFITIVRDSQGDWWVVWPGFLFTACT
jgi:hypothetical protein